MKEKIAVLLCLVLLASLATLTITLATIEPELHESTLDFPLPPLPGPTFGDPIGGGGGPH